MQYTDSQLVESFLAQIGQEAIAKEFKASGTRKAGHPSHRKIQDCFPGRQTGGEKPEPEKKDEKKEEKKPGDSLKESKTETAVILLGDADMLNDMIAVDSGMNPITGQRIVQPKNGNLNLCQSMIEQMAGTRH